MEASSPTSAQPHRAWLLVLAVPIVELLAHLWIGRSVASDRDYDQALTLVRSEWQAGDLVTIAPAWADPLLRRAAGDRIDRAMAGRSTTDAYGRIWTLALRGHSSPDTPREPPEFERNFGPLRLTRHALPAPRVLFDFVEHIREAQVVRRENGQSLPCGFIDGFGGNAGGGIQAGPLEGPRHLCDPNRPWLWVGATTTMDFELRGRRCVWNHPQGSEPIVTTFSSVPLGEALVVHGGLWWEQERTLDRGDVDLVVRIGDEEIGRMRHHDGDGWARMEASVPAALRGQRAEVRIEVSAENPDWRTFCWAAQSLAPRGAR